VRRAGSGIELGCHRRLDGGTALRRAATVVRRAGGIGSTSLPVATSRARAGVQPELSLTSDSGHGNGPFGFGWSLLTAVTPRSRFAMPLSLPSITPKTDKGQPGYDDAAQTHVSLLSGSEDLVPAFSARVALSLEGAHVRVGPLD